MEHSADQQNEATNNHDMQTSNNAEDFVDIQIKDELEIEDSADPMNLLQLAEERDYFDEQSASEHLSSMGGTERDDEENDVTIVNLTLWQKWRSQFPWLMHGKDDGNIGYCFYCDLTLTIRNAGHITKHETSVHHNERKASYLDFMRSEEQANDSSTAIEIKLEGEDISNIAEIKTKRAAQREKLQNFNWHFWVQKHDWLLRDERDDGNYGRCKYCKDRLYVEFSYLRTRHEMTTRHRKAEKLYTLKQATNENQNNMVSYVARDLVRKGVISPQNNANDDEEKKSKFGNLLYDRFFENIPNIPNVGRCKLCHIRMVNKNYRKHMKCKMHVQNMRSFKRRKDAVLSTKREVNNVKKEEAQNGIGKKIDWSYYEVNHEWLTSDPDDSAYGYCKYCKKRLKCLGNVSKCKQHENSALHIHIVKEFKNSGSTKDDTTTTTGNNSNEGEQEEQGDDKEATDTENADADAEEDNGDDNDTSDEEQSEVEGKEDNSASKTNAETQSEGRNNKKSTRMLKGSDEWFAVMPWCKKIPSKANFYCCVYCNKQIGLAVSRTKHQLTLNHKLREKEFLLKACVRPLKTKPQNKFPRLITLQNAAANSLYCRHCRIRFANHTTRVKHERSLRHMQAIRLYMAKKKRFVTHQLMEVGQQHAENTEHHHVAKATQDVLIPAKFREPNTSMSPTKQSDVLSWRNNYHWLEYKRKDTKHAFCKICSQKCYMPTIAYVLKHQRSIKHIRLRTKLRLALNKNKSPNSRNTSEQQEQNTGEQQQQEQHENSITSRELPTTTATIEQNELFWSELQAKYAWFKPNNNRENLNFGYCIYCKLPFKTMNVQKHLESAKHRLAKKQNMKNNNNNNNSITETHNISASSVVQLDDTESDRDDANLKSEPIDEVLEYLLEHTVNASKRGGAAASELEPIAKRAKTQFGYNSVVETAKRLSSAHNEILNITRSLEATIDDQTKRRSIIKSSLTLAACLSPFVQQQQLEDAFPAAISASPHANTTRNTFDLFFDSISETFKKLPNDIAAEGKVKIMQLLYDLEMRAYQRQLIAAETPSNNTEVLATPSSTQGGCFEGDMALRPHTSTPTTTTTTTSVLTNGELHAATLANNNSNNNDNSSGSSSGIADTSNGIGERQHISNGHDVVALQNKSCNGGIQQSFRDTTNPPNRSHSTIIAQMKLTPQAAAHMNSVSTPIANNNVVVNRKLYAAPTQAVNVVNHAAELYDKT